MKNVNPSLLEGTERLGRVGKGARRHGTRALALGAAVATLAWCFASCSYIEPQVGKFRGSCKGSSGEYARPDAYAPGQPDPRCTPDEDDDACAICESVSSTSPIRAAKKGSRPRRTAGRSSRRAVPEPNGASIVSANSAKRNAAFPERKGSLVRQRRRGLAKSALSMKSTAKAPPPYRQYEAS
jgi:hypothetical protein